MEMNKLYQASRVDASGGTNPLNVPSNIKNHPDFNRNVKKFHGCDNNSDTQS
jgi:hypothetical protein